MERLVRSCSHPITHCSVENISRVRHSKTPVPVVHSSTLQHRASQVNQCPPAALGLAVQLGCSTRRRLANHASSLQPRREFLCHVDRFTVALEDLRTNPMLAFELCIQRRPSGEPFVLCLQKIQPHVTALIIPKTNSVSLLMQRWSTHRAAQVAVDSVAYIIAPSPRPF